MIDLKKDRADGEMISDSSLSSLEARKLVEDPVKVKANMDKVMKLLENIGMKMPGEWTKSVESKYREIMEYIVEKNMNEADTMNFLNGKIGQMKLEVDTFKIRQAIAGSALGVMNLNSEVGEKKESFLTKEQKYMIIMGVAILAVIIALAYVNPVWAGKAALALISVLGGVVVINGKKNKPESAVKALLPVSDIVPA